MGFFRRSRPDPEPAKPTFEVSVYEPSAVKAAEFSQSLMQTLAYGGWYAGSYGAMYRRQPAVRAVVDFLARNVAQLNGKVYERVSDTDRMEVNDHPLASLLRNPNPRTTRYVHMFSTVADVAIYDRAYWRILRAGRQVAVWRISPAKMSVETDDHGVHRYRLDGREIPRSQLVVFPGYSPDTDTEGVSPLETLRRVLQEEMTVQQHREAMWANAAFAGSVISRPATAPAWSDPARVRFRADLDALLTGPSNAGKVAVLEEGMTWDTPNFNPPDTEYIASRRLTYEEVAIVYFGPIGGRAWLEQATATASAENHRQMYQDVLGPFLRYLQDEIELQLLPEVQPVGRTGTYFEFNLADKLKGSFEEQARVATTSTGVPAVSVNESRSRMNLPRIDDDLFDLPVMPLNVMYGGQPAVTVPTADRSSPPSPPLLDSNGTPRQGPPVDVNAARNLAEMVQKIYLGVGVVLSADEARDIINQAGGDLQPGFSPTKSADKGEAGAASMLRRFFERQERAVMSSNGATDWSRWDRELAADLTPWLDPARAAMLAASVNADTVAAIEAASLRDVFADAKANRSQQIAASLSAT